MGYNREIFKYAKDELSQRKLRAIAEAEKRCSEVYSKHPRLQEITNKLAHLSIDVARAILANNDIKQDIKKLKDENLALQRERSTILKNIGLSEDYLEPRFYCTKCNDDGLIDGKMCDCLKDLMKQKATQELNKLSPLSLCDFKDFSLKYYSDAKNELGIIPREKMKEILNYCQCYAEDFHKRSPSILMTGRTGLGKTHLSLAIAKSAINRGFGVIYGSVQTLVSRLEHERFDKFKPESDENTLHMLCNCDLLILDDLGAEFLTSFVVSVLNEIINFRMMADKPTIISTNLSPEELEARYSERISSRIIGYYHALNFVGRDIRQLKRTR